VAFGEVGENHFGSFQAQCDPKEESAVMSKHALRLLASLFCVSLGWIGFTSMANAQETKSKLYEVLDRGKVIVGVSNAYPPFGFVNEKNELVGFDVDVAKLLAKAIFGDPSKLELVVQSFDARWANVQSGKIDVGIQATTIYPDRALKVAFTRPYLDSGIAVVVRRKLENVKTIADLNNPKYTIADLTNPQMAERVKKYAPQAKVLIAETGSAQILAVTSGRADAAQLEYVQALYAVKSNPELRMLSDLMSNVQSVSLFLRQGDFTWWLFLDTFVAEMTGGNLYDDYRAMYVKWFGSEPPPPRPYELVRPTRP
jgi:polar amino acid transport system substrate-binding protein